MQEQSLTSIFSSNPDKYYKVALFGEKGFKRQSCHICKKYYWSKVDRHFCPDHENYGFIENPPTLKRFDFVNAWKEIEKYFIDNGHSVVNRYPVVCRWREDLFFTIASIVDFQRIMNGKVVFELPHNPLVVPQMCLRFKDIENVGVTGRHYTSFCMIGQTVNADAPGGYWKDKCIEIDYRMLNKTLGIPDDEITFVEDVWIGAGAFGCSLEYYVRGLELGNAVFTEFEGDEKDYRLLSNKIIDMGAGLERLSWITMGTPTSYDCTFGPVIEKLFSITNTELNPEVFTKYIRTLSGKYSLFENDVSSLNASISKEFGMSVEKLNSIISPYQALYTLADHTRTLLFAISDGSLPSNVGGGYNLRVILRRSLSILNRLRWNIDLDEIVDLHVDYLRSIFPELEEHRNEVKAILQLESKRYTETKTRMEQIAQGVKSSKKSLTVEDLIRMYESDGITPDFLMELDVIKNIPSSFYTKLANLHVSQDSAKVEKPLEISEVQPTKLLYYENDLTRNFESKLLKVVDKKYLILRETAFYPRGGGQEPDHGEIDGFKVVDVIKQGDIVIHTIEIHPDNNHFIEGMMVKGSVDDSRRNAITRHHTATHILNSSARTNLGSWVWQNSAFKEESYARLDITHHSALTKSELHLIESTANKIVRKNLPVDIKTFERGNAEQKYSFRIYQGGIVPSNSVRIVNIEKWDVEACGGTHVRRTGEIGLIKIVKSERIQDGVVRLEYVVGESAMKYIQNQENQLDHIIHNLGSNREKITESFDKSIKEAENTKRKLKALMRKVAPAMMQNVSENSRILTNGLKLYTVRDEELDEEYYIALGGRSVDHDPLLIFIAFVINTSSIRVIVFVGRDAQKIVKASTIARKISIFLGGSGGGSDKFGQGGGKNKASVEECMKNMQSTVESIFTSEKKNDKN